MTTIIVVALICATLLALGFLIFVKAPSDKAKFADEAPLRIQQMKIKEIQNRQQAADNFLSGTTYELSKETVNKFLTEFREARAEFEKPKSVMNVQIDKMIDEYNNLDKSDLSYGIPIHAYLRMTRRQYEQYQKTGIHPF